MRGRVVHLDGSPAGGFLVWAEGASGRGAAVESDSFGEYSLIARPGTRELLASSDGFLTLRAGMARDREGWVPVTVVAPSTRLQGQVVDRGAIAIAGATLEAEYPTASLGLSYDELRTSQPRTFTARSLGDGTFELGAIGRSPAGLLAVEGAGFSAKTVPLPLSSEGPFTIVLERPGESPRAGFLVTGLVEHDDGRPAPKAVVRCDRHRAETDTRGTFSIALPRTLHAGTALLGWLPGHEPAVLEDVTGRLRQSGGVLSGIVLRIGAESLALRGMVIDDDGVPRAGWRVSVQDGTAAGWDGMPGETIESVIGTTGSTVTTDESGEFSIDGLRQRPYTLVVWSVDTLESYRFEDNRPGPEAVELVVPAEASLRTLHGTVRSTGGMPLAGVTVATLLVPTVHWNRRIPPGSLGTVGRSATTDELGGFVIEDLPDSGLQIGIGGDSVAGLHFWDLSPDMDWNAAVFEVPRRATFKVDFADADVAYDSFSLLDGDGDELELWLRDLGSVTITSSGSIGDGASAEYAVSEEAETLVLRAGGEERGRHPIRLSPSGVTVFRTP